VEEYAQRNYTGMKHMESVEEKSNARDTSTRTMKRQYKPTSEFAVCIDNTQYPASLELHKIYRVLPDEDAAKDGDIRVIDESGEDYLYPAEWFVPIKLPQKVRASVLKAS
jgi:hypothetical protein